MKLITLYSLTLLLAIIFSAPGFSQNSSTDKRPDPNVGLKTGPEIGAAIPQFNLPDQNGKMRDLASITGPNGAIILFYRSANW